MKMFELENIFIHHNCGIAVYHEVENRVEAFREMLYRKLLHLPLSLDEQKKLIRLVPDFVYLLSNVL